MYIRPDGIIVKKKVQGLASWQLQVRKNLSNIHLSIRNEEHKSSTSSVLQGGSVVKVRLLWFVCKTRTSFRRGLMLPERNLRPLTVVNEKRQRHLRTRIQRRLPGQEQQVLLEGCPVVWKRERRRRHEGARICKRGHRSV